MGAKDESVQSEKGTPLAEQEEELAASYSNASTVRAELAKMQAQRRQSIDAGYHEETRFFSPKEELVARKMRMKDASPGLNDDGFSTSPIERLKNQLASRPSTSEMEAEDVSEPLSYEQFRKEVMAAHNSNPSLDPNPSRWSYTLICVRCYTLHY